MWIVFQGLIGAAAFYLPAVLLYSVPWIMVQTAGVNRRNAGWIWGAHLSNLFLIVGTVVLIASLSLWCSARYRRSLPALLCAYAAAGLFMALPRYAGMVLGVSGRLFADAGGDAASKILAVCHAPYLSHWWPAHSGPAPQFWPLLRAFHLLLLSTLAAIACWDARRIIMRE